MSSLATKHRSAATASLGPLGTLLRHWRSVRGMSQLDLALEAETSARHISFVETGRSQPSKAMVLRLAEALDVPLREQNALLMAAGYAAVYQESQLGDAELAQVQQALDFMLRSHEPYPAFVVNRAWDVLHMNTAMEALLSPLPILAGKATPNVLRLLLHPEALRPHIVNWEEVAYGVLIRAQRESHASVATDLREVLDEVLAYPGMPENWRTLNPAEATTPLIPIVVANGDQRTAWFTTIATFGTPQDITLQELRIEFLFPADVATEAAVQQQTHTDTSNC